MEHAQDPFPYRCRADRNRPCGCACLLLVTAGAGAAQVDPLGRRQCRHLWLQGCRLGDQNHRGGARWRIRRHRQSLSVDDRGHEGDHGGRWRDRLHRRHRHDGIRNRRRCVPELQAVQGHAGAHLVRLPDGTFIAVAPKATQFKCWKDFSGKPVFYRRPAS